MAKGIWLTANEKRSIPAMYQSGMEAKDIAEVLYLAPNTIYRYLRSFKVVLRSTPNWSKYRKTAHQRNVLARSQQFALNID